MDIKLTPKELKWKEVNEHYIMSHTPYHGTIVISYCNLKDKTVIVLNVPWFSQARFNVSSIEEAKQKAQMLYNEKLEETFNQLFEWRTK
jgi:hypothetical protein